jgi:6-phosphogluconolactonase
VTDLRVSADDQGLAQAVAEALVDRLAAVQAEGRAPSVVLTGGTIAGDIYRAVAQLPRERVDWSQVDFWWGDERYVPADSSDRNDRGAELDLLDVVAADPARVHAMPAADEAHPDVASAAAAYARTVASHAPETFDVVLLGLGPDGHVASLFPGFPQLDVVDDLAVPVTDSPKPPPERISLTFPRLSRAEEVWFVVSGQGKAEAVARALAEEGSVHETPARGVIGGRSVWWLDEAAASAL